MTWVKIFVIALVAFALVLEPIYAESAYATVSLSLAQALLPAAVFATFAWFPLRSECKIDFLLGERSVAIMLIVIALVGIGGAYGEARDGGLTPLEANVSALTGLGGLLLAVALALLILGRRIRKSQNDA